MSKKLHSAAELAAYKTGEIKTEEAKEQEDRYLRLVAEFDNFKKRTARQYADIIRNANEELIEDILPILDDFHHALESVNSGSAESAGGENVVSGMKMIYDKFLALLKERGIVQIEAMGQPFDPQYHDAVMQLPSDKEEGMVVGVVAPGYILNGKVIRHAKVVVSSSNR